MKAATAAAAVAIIILVKSNFLLIRLADGYLLLISLVLSVAVKLICG